MRALNTLDPTSRSLRVFISSTFADMQAERDELAKFVFPELRRRCEALGLVFLDVDLRWGITDEQRAEGNVLQTCLEEIGHCQIFIALLGDRYGWMPDKIPGSLVRDHPWLTKHPRHSITALEIECALRRAAISSQDCFFYLRDSNSRAGATAAPSTVFCEADPDRQGRLADLKLRIKRALPDSIKQFGTPKELGALVLDDLTSLIEARFGNSGRLNRLESEARAHDFVEKLWGQVYVGGNHNFSRLEDHVEGNGPPLVVLGEPGAGKTALIANWARLHQRVHPQEHLLTHYLEASPRSARWDAMVRRIMEMLRDRLAIEIEIPRSPDSLIAAFHKCLSTAAAHGRVVLVLDGLDGLEDVDQAQDLVWLPRLIPENVRLILTTAPGRSQSALAEREWPTLVIDPLTVAERRDFVTEYLRLIGKTLADEHVNHIVGAGPAANPLYLRALLEELKLLGSHERLREYVRHYLDARSVAELYELILARWEEDYDAESGMVRDSLTLLYAGRRGLLETELLDLLGRDDTPLPQGQWAPFHVGARGALIDRSGHLMFAHDALREAVRARYMQNPTDELAAHGRLADYFEQSPSSTRRLEELPWQLAKSSQWQRLHALLADPVSMSELWSADELESRTYWMTLEGNSDFRMVQAYGRPVPGGKADKIATILEAFGHHTRSLELRLQALPHLRASGDPQALASALLAAGVGLINAAREEEGQALLHEAWKVYSSREMREADPGRIANEGALLAAAGAPKAALEVLKAAERRSREAENPSALIACLTNRAAIHQSQGDRAAALQCLVAAEELLRASTQKVSLAVNLLSQAKLMMKTDLDAAMDLFRQAELIQTSIGDSWGLHETRLGQAAVLGQQKRYSEALEMFREDERHCRRMLLSDSDYMEGLRLNLMSQATILTLQGDFPAALEAHKAHAKMCREVGAWDELVLNLGRQAELLVEMKEISVALSCLEDRELVCDSAGDEEGVRESLEAQARIALEYDELVTAWRASRKLLDLLHSASEEQG